MNPSSEQLSLPGALVQALTRRAGTANEPGCGTYRNWVVEVPARVRRAAGIRMG